MPAKKNPNITELTEEIILLALLRVRDQLADDMLPEKMHLDAAKTAATLLEIKKRVPNVGEDTSFDSDFGDFS
jgi:hypothetical protein